MRSIIFLILSSILITNSLCNFNFVKATSNDPVIKRLANVKPNATPNIDMDILPFDFKSYYYNGKFYLTGDTDLLVMNKKFEEEHYIENLDFNRSFFYQGKVYYLNSQDQQVMIYNTENKKTERGYLLSPSYNKRMKLDTIRYEENGAFSIRTKDPVYTIVLETDSPKRKHYSYNEVSTFTKVGKFAFITKYGKVVATDYELVDPVYIDDYDVDKLGYMKTKVFSHRNDKVIVHSFFYYYTFDLDQEETLVSGKSEPIAFKQIEDQGYVDFLNPIMTQVGNSDVFVVNRFFSDENQEKYIYTSLAINIETKEQTYLEYKKANSYEDILRVEAQSPYALGKRLVTEDKIYKILNGEEFLEFEY